MFFNMYNGQVKQSKFPENTHGPIHLGFDLQQGVRSAELHLHSPVFQRNCLLQQLAEPDLTAPQSPPQTHPTPSLNTHCYTGHRSD